MIINEMPEWVVDVKLWDPCKRYRFHVDPGSSYVIELPPVHYGFMIYGDACLRQPPNVNLSE